MERGERGGYYPEADVPDKHETPTAKLNRKRKALQEQGWKEVDIDAELTKTDNEAEQEKKAA